MILSIFLLIEKINTLWPSCLRFFMSSKTKFILVLYWIVLSYTSYWSTWSISSSNSASFNLSNNDSLNTTGLDVSVPVFFLVPMDQDASANSSLGKSLIGLVSTSKALSYFCCLTLTTLFVLRVRLYQSTTCSDSAYCWTSRANISSAESKPKFYLLGTVRPAIS